MNPARITLSVTQGSLKGREYVFEEAAWCVIGRGEDCTIRLPSDQEHAGVSRHHCLLEIAPPSIRVRDLGSLNGTHVNGQKIGQRPAYLPPEEADLESFRTRELKDGDEVRIGYTILRVAIVGVSEEQEVYFPIQGRQE